MGHVLSAAGMGRASGPESPAKKARLQPICPRGSGTSAVKGSGAESSKQARRVPASGQVGAEACAEALESE